MKATATIARMIFASALCLMLVVMLSSFASRAQQKETAPKPINSGTQTKPQSPSKIPPPNKIPSPTKTPPVVQLPGPISTNVPGLRGGNWDFERGDLQGWTMTGTAFSSQPTFENNVEVRRPGTAPNHQGRYWIGTYEDRPTPSDTWSTTKGDAPKGTMTSVEFALNQRFISFLVGGGSEARGERVELLVRVEDFDRLQAEQPRVNDPFGGTRGTRLPFVRREGESVIVYQAGGQDSELMRRVSWDVSQLQGAVAQIRIVDSSNGAWGHINIDDFRFTATAPDHTAPVWGFADTHAHPAAQLAYGGLLYWGETTGALNVALPSCELAHGIGGTGLPDVGAGLRVAGEAIANLNPIGLMNAPISSDSVRALAVNAVEGSFGHLTGGAPKFDGWPRFNTKLHQHMHEDWIRRAYQGGLRLMVAHAVNAELLGHLKPKEGHPVNDKDTYNLQIAAIKRMADRNREWMAIAYTPQQARDIVGQNKLALVLGVEVDTLGDWRNEAEANAGMDAELERLYGLGVRHMFPIHLANNPLGGFSLYDDLFNFNNYTLRNDLAQVRSGADSRGAPYDVQYKLMEDIPATDDMFFWDSVREALRIKNLETLRLPRRTISLRGIVDEIVRVKPAYDALPSHKNAQGLTPTGERAVSKMMELGMIIEVGHMSELSAERTMQLAENRDANGLRGYPLTTGHTTFRELKWRRGETEDHHKLPHEADLPPDQLERLRRLGGVVGPLTNGGDVRSWGTKVPNNAPGSVKSFAQSYLYAVEKMQGRGVSLATDMAMLGGMGPRFGSWAASGAIGDNLRASRERYTRAGDFGISRPYESATAWRRMFAGTQTFGVRYATPVRDVRGYRFDGPEDVYTSDERDVWVAVMLGKSDISIDGTDLGGAFFGLRTAGNAAWIKDVAIGIRAAAQGRPLESLPQPNGVLTSNVWGLYNFAVVQRGAWHAYMGSDSNPTPGTPLVIQDAAMGEVAAKVRSVAFAARAMDGPNAPLTRMTLGEHDSDFNLDGFAHYGMLPDLLQDAKNVGLTYEDLTPLFRSAEDYIQMWEKCARMRMAP